MADAVLVAWQPAAVDWSPQYLEQGGGQGRVQGEQVVAGQYQDYVLVRYALPDRIQRLAFLQQMRATPGVVFAELDQAVVAQSGRPVYFPLLGLADGLPLPPRNCYDTPIAIIDSGVDRFHPALAAGHILFRDDINLIPTGGIQDASGHGTHIAGLMLAAETPAQQVSGICSHGQLLSIRFLGPAGGSIADAVKGIYHALDADVKIINASWVASSSQALADAVQAASDRGVLLVAAAGNSGWSLDTFPTYPASYGTRMPLVVGVANINHLQTLHTGAGASSYGAHSVDLAAPGVSLRSTWLSGGYAYQTGTSMSAPLVSAAMAATWHRFPAEPAAAIKAALLNSLTPAAALQGKLRYPGHLNVSQLLQDSPQNLFKPVWFNYAWQEYADILEFQGYQLNQVSQINWQPVTGDLRYLTFRVVSPARLEVDLPLGWEGGGTLTLNAAGDLLQSVIINDVTTLPRAGALSDQQVTERQRRSFDWDGAGVQLQRNDGSGRWEAATVVMDNTQVLKVSGRDLSAEWVFSFSGHPRLRLYELYARTPKGWHQLTTADGWVQTAANTGNLVISQPDTLPWVEREKVDGAEVQVVYLSVLTGVPPSSSSRCFVAGQVYASDNAPQVLVLRQFRDEVLLTSRLGRAFVSFYYAHSPGWVEWMQDKPRLQAVVRWLLDGVVSCISFCYYG
ncbi:MAG: S8 family serine peptidase [Marinospirillum sp.]|uniref:S8 family serine peptidase n=1 Tax=Marinospirillum sp. TaxID=2183934 RepID=UPI001A0240E4|nr:S8 family serine peptidase [Marinospirillum sp.]MBE0508080.1 S8 family serine peptidase [Marinospirillum sp.]